MAKILLVDDEASVRCMVREILERSSHEVIEAANGEEAVKKYGQEHVDLIITDLVMPDKSGIDLIMELKERHGDIRVLAISGGGGITGRFDYLPIARLVGANAILKKPFKIDELNSKVQELLSA